MRFFLLGVLASGLACGGSSSSDAATDAGVVDGVGGETGTRDAASTDASSGADASPSEAGDGAEACNTLANVAPVITYVQVASDPPSPTGGTIATGTYVMTAATIYTGPTGPTGPSGTSQTTVQIAGATIQIVNSGEPPTRTVTLTTSGSSFIATDSCPDAEVFDGAYTATATTLVLQLAGGTDDAGARTLVETFTKQ